MCKTHHNKTYVKLKTKEKSWKYKERSGTLCMGKNSSSNSGLIFRNHGGCETFAKYFSSTKRAQNFYIQEKYPSGMKGEIKIFLDGGKQIEFVSSSPTQKEYLI